jgi:hypothetical protein
MKFYTRAKNNRREKPKSPELKQRLEVAEFSMIGRLSLSTGETALGTESV